MAHLRARGEGREAGQDSGLRLAGVCGGRRPSARATLAARRSSCNTSGPAGARGLRVAVASTTIRARGRAAHSASITTPKAIVAAAAADGAGALIAAVARLAVANNSLAASSLGVATATALPRKASSTRRPLGPALVRDRIASAFCWRYNSYSAQPGCMRRCYSFGRRPRRWGRRGRSLTFQSPRWSSSISWECGSRRRFIRARWASQTRPGRGARRRSAGCDSRTLSRTRTYASKRLSILNALLARSGLRSAC